MQSSLGQYPDPWCDQPWQDSTDERTTLLIVMLVLHHIDHPGEFTSNFSSFRHSSACSKLCMNRPLINISEGSIAKQSKSQRVHTCVSLIRGNEVFLMLNAVLICLNQKHNGFYTEHSPGHRVRDTGLCVSS